MTGTSLDQLVSMRHSVLYVSGLTQSTRFLDEEEVFDSDFQSTDEEAVQDEEATAEKQFADQEKQERRVGIPPSVAHSLCSFLIPVRSPTYA